MDTIDWINKNAGFLNLIFSSMVAISTVAYAVLTRYLFKETARLRMAATDPSISIHIEPSASSIQLLDIVLQNFGSGPAYNITFIIDPDVPVDGERRLSDIACFREIKYMAPGQQIRSFFGSAVELLNRQPIPVINVRATYCTKSGKPLSEEFTLDAGAYRGISSTANQSAEQVARSLKSIADDLHRATGMDRLRVDTMTHQDVVNQLQRFREQYEPRNKRRVVRLIHRFTTKVRGQS